MTGANDPLTSLEVRWFFEGGVAENAKLREWFETTKRHPSVGRPEWKGRLADQPDVYLVIPDYHDMGIKWREGSLQIKGRTVAPETRRFCDRHQGNVEHWIKWSYPKLPEAFQAAFGETEGSDICKIAVHKVRALRKIQIDPVTRTPEEVDPKSIVACGLGFELTELEVASKKYISMGFEAFPDHAALEPTFMSTVAEYMSELADESLEAAKSLSYPGWLAQFASVT
jgi:hypothetical protein